MHVFMSKTQLGKLVDLVLYAAYISYNIYGPQMMDIFGDSLSSELEKCDSLDAFQVLFASSGSTGSGLSCKILE